MEDLTSALPLSIPTLARALDRSPDCVKLLDLDGRLLWMNSNGLCAMEIDAFQNVKGRKWTELWPDAATAQLEAALGQSVDTGMATFTGFCPTAKGAQRWWDVSVHPAADEAGQTVGYISISRDVTDRENQVTALETVVAEMRHRLRNSYTIVCGLARGLARGNAGLTDFAVELQRRITAISEAQSLFVSGNARTSLASLIDILVAPFRQHDGLDLTLDLDPHIVIDARVSDAIALVIGEFVVNSAKHGAIAKGGEIAVTGRLEGQALQVVWRESAIDPVIATAREGGQGLKIITQMLKANNAQLDLAWGSHGPEAVVTFRGGFS